MRQPENICPNNATEALVNAGALLQAKKSLELAQLLRIKSDSTAMLFLNAC